ncbi:YonK family protein [Paenibacillus elgii]|uniref:YonK family protein n=1 Tax=Paenibacillus elgii TaxID=189691 RepID=UPI00203F0594|nr:YonK family protein [Paenibacillus elgii]MCM3274307.1 YonK family protein [Paenibacillus elgii]MCM3274369.1 YonK family protein [Paenibacillus elgii]
MAKKVHAYSLKGEYYHDQMVVAEYDKKTEETTYYSLKDILAEFDGKSFSITLKEEDEVPSVKQPFTEE